MKLFRKIRPSTVDRIAEQSDSVLGKVWQIIRMFLVDRAVYWGLALAYAAPLIVGLLGGGFSFSGGILWALALGLAFTVLSLGCALLLAGCMSLFRIKCAGQPSFRMLQKVVFALAAVGFMAAATYLAPSVLAVTRIVGYVVGTVLLYGAAEWARGHRCTGKACAAKKS